MGLNSIWGGDEELTPHFLACVMEQMVVILTEIENTRKTTGLGSENLSGRVVFELPSRDPRENSKYTIRHSAERQRLIGRRW